LIGLKFIVESNLALRSYNSFVLDIDGILGELRGLGFGRLALLEHLFGFLVL
jgi:hypothetical protein